MTSGCLRVNKPNLLITGGSEGLGRATVDEFSASFNIVNLSRGDTAKAINVNVDLADTFEVAEKVRALNDPVDLCILNAGQLGTIDKAAQISHEELSSLLSLHVTSNKIIFDKALELGCRNYIVISSGAAKRNYDGWLLYCVTKASLRALAMQYQKDYPNITVKLISPGILKTAMNEKILAADTAVFPDLEKFHAVDATSPAESARVIFQRYVEFLKREEAEIDLRDEAGF